MKCISWNRAFLLTNVYQRLFTGSILCQQMFCVVKGFCLSSWYISWWVRWSRLVLFIHSFNQVLSAFKRPLCPLITPTLHSSWLVGEYRRVDSLTIQGSRSVRPYETHDWHTENSSPPFLSNSWLLCQRGFHNKPKVASLSYVPQSSDSKSEKCI